MTHATVQVDHIYADQLFKCGEGLPLWYPEPSKHGEVLIGDVGFIERGRFYRLFNAMRSADDELNRKYGVPGGNQYKPFVTSEYNLAEYQNALSPGPICSRSLKRVEMQGEVAAHGFNAALQYHCTEDRGAFIILQDPATRKELHRSRRMAAYMSRNLKEWYHFASEKLDVEVTQEDIMFVRGHVKTTQWEVGTITHSGRDAKVSIGADSDIASASFSVHVARHESGSLQSRKGPPEALEHHKHKNISHHHSHSHKKKHQESQSDVPADTDDEALASSSRRSLSLAEPSTSSVALPLSPSVTQETPSKGSDASNPVLDMPQQRANENGLPMNQCIFLHYYRLKKRFFPLLTKLEAAAEPRDPSAPGDDDEPVIEEVPAIQKPYDPLNYVLDYILDHSQAETAVATDRDLIDICKGEIPDDIPAFLESVQPQIEVNEEGLGMLWFPDDDRPKASEELSSVATEVDENPTEQPSGANQPPIENNNPPNGPEAETQDDEQGEKKKIMNRMRAGHLLQGSILQLPNDAHLGSVSSLAFSPNGQLVAAGFEDGSIIFWNAITRERLNCVRNHTDIVCQLEFSPDSTILASSSRDRAIIMWDVATGQERARLLGHEGFVNCLVWANDGLTLASGSVDFTVRLWDVETATLRAKCQGHNALILKLAFSPDDSKLASAGADCEARIWDTRNGTLLTELKGHEGVIYTVAFSPDGRRVLTSADDGSVRVWNVATGDALVILREHTGAVWTAVWSSDGKRVLSAASDRVVHICDSYEGERVGGGDLRGTDGLAHAPTFSKDAKFIAAGGEDYKVRIWKVDNDSALADLDGHQEASSYIRWAPDGKSIASAAEDGVVRLWNLPAYGIGSAQEQTVATE
ncbi:WD40 repeat-like protein [Laetiporus sulphureus 93-53]|uniref:WD40 repeat-like protein n=1 Tax=Laetiporus sulphureus 93-53 TaxID=1314785 RepID=A0A165CPC6_9APHY|nr:WD40 repeat-like protein [Laetiporus sulphureus 93-53]KZT03175.1 WD40 repeat-like protein [Laetiporus sulphureus 93-53]